MRNENEILEMTAAQYIPYLFDNCNNNTLTVVRYDESLEESWEVDYAVKCAAADVDSVVQGFQQLRAALDRLAMVQNALEESESPETMLPAEDFAIWNIYLRPFAGFDVPQETMQTIIAHDLANELTQEEQETLTRYYNWFKDQCNLRLQGKHQPSYRLINRARRYTRLKNLGAPAIITENEARVLAEEFVIFHHAIA